MKTEFMAALAGLCFNKRAAERFLQADYDNKVFYEYFHHTELQHGEKEAFFVAHAALKYYAKHAELVPWSFLARGLKKRNAGQDSIAVYKKLWNDLKKKRKIKFGEWQEQLNEVIDSYRKMRHKNVYAMTGLLYEQPCFGKRGELEGCKECPFWRLCKDMKESDEEDPTKWILDWSASQIEQIKIDTKATHIRVYNVGELIVDAIERLDDDRQDVDPDGKLRVRGIHTPWPSLTTNIGGWMRKRLYMFTSRSGQGKSAALLQSCNVSAMNGHPTLLFNLEMPVLEELVYRIIAWICGIDSDDINFEALMTKLVDNNMMDLVRERATAWLEMIHGCPNYEIVDIPLQTKLSAIFRHIDRFIARVGRKDILVALDYFNLLFIPSSAARPDLWWGQQAEQLHAFCRDRDIPILSALQLNRSADGAKRLTARHLRDADKIMDNLDGLWGLLPLSQDVMRLQCVKGRYFKPVDYLLNKELWKMGFSEFKRVASTPIEDDEEDELF